MWVREEVDSQLKRFKGYALYLPFLRVSRSLPLLTLSVSIPRPGASLVVFLAPLFWSAQIIS